MDEERKKYFCKLTKEQILSLTRTDFTLSECKEILEETRLSELDREIATLWLVKCMSEDEIAEKLNLGDRRTVHAHIWKGVNKKPSISHCLKLTLLKIFHSRESIDQ